MDKKYILVTGGAGYIGAFTVKELLDHNYPVLVVDSLENGHREAVDKRAVLEVADLGDKKAIQKIFHKYSIEAVIDFAAYLAVGESMINPQKYLKNNVENFINLLEVLKDSGCKYVIKSSTASTYGDPKDKYFPLEENYQDSIKLEKSALLEGEWNGEKTSSEDFLTKYFEFYNNIISSRQELKLDKEEKTKLRIPASIYGVTKLTDEILMQKYEKMYGLKSIALRYFNVCGASIDGKLGENKPKPTTLMTLAIDSIFSKNKLKVFGNDYPTKDGTGLRDYIHPLDLATGHLRALEYLKKHNTSQVINLGRGEGFTVLEVIKAVEKASGKNINFEFVPRRSGDPAISFAKVEKAHRLLDWQAKYNLDDMAKASWKWTSNLKEGRVYY